MLADKSIAFKLIPVITLSSALIFRDIADAKIPLMALL
jgi:hypothetical protein